jgi:Autographiviridae endonuclease VII
MPSRTPRQRELRNARQRERYATDPEYRKRILAETSARYQVNKTDPDYRKRRRRKARGYRLKYHYGMTEADYNALLAKQKGRCAVCKRKPRYRLHVDHDHRTKRVRRLLCRRCNPALGLFRDDLRVLRGAVRYLAAELKRRRAERRAPKRVSKKTRRSPRGRGETARRRSC